MKAQKIIGIIGYTFSIIGGIASVIYTSKEMKDFIKQ